MNKVTTSTVFRARGKIDEDFFFLLTENSDLNSKLTYGTALVLCQQTPARWLNKLRLVLRATPAASATYPGVRPTPGTAAGRRGGPRGLWALSRRYSGSSSGRPCRPGPASSSPCSPERSASVGWSGPHGTEGGRGQRSAPSLAPHWLGGTERLTLSDMASSNLWLKRHL